ncbi:Transposase IS4 [Popillia japonica]|uniref:Transposase IS4 n=1 Tax=Popillia japonica TaxID=7064 RepID=A0AAW1ICH8_POPJA
MAGVKKAYLNTSELRSTDGTAPAAFSAVMSERRFHVLIRSLPTREERAKYDNLAPVRDIFENFVKACSLNFIVGEYVTVDEMLEPFRRKCRKIASEKSTHV